MNPLLQTLDSLLLAPFFLPEDPLIGYWLGCSVLAAVSVAAGFATSSLLRKMNQRFLATSSENALLRQSEALAARRIGDEEAYQAANNLANEAFGRWFFQSATIGIAGLWPAFLAAGWLSTRFDHVVFSLPFTGTSISFVGPLVLCLVLWRLLVSIVQHALSRIGPSSTPSQYHLRPSTSGTNSVDCPCPVPSSKLG